VSATACPAGRCGRFVAGSEAGPVGEPLELAVEVVAPVRGDLCGLVDFSR
jgi:hypothetical protein